MSARFSRFGTTTLAVALTSAALLLAPASSTFGSTAPNHVGFLLSRGPALPHLRNGALARTPAGLEALIATERTSPDESSSTAHWLYYLTRTPAESSWQQHVVPGISGGENAELTAQLSTNGKVVVVVMSLCGSNRIYTDETSATARTMLAPTRALTKADYQCKYFGGHTRQVVFAGSATLPHDQLVMVFNNDNPGTAPSFTVGSPGAAFPAPAALPNPGNLPLSINAIARDAKTGNVTVVATDKHAGVFEWVRTPAGAWSDPKPVVANTATELYQATSVTSALGKVTIAVERTFKSPTLPYHQRFADGIAIITGAGHGTFSSPIKLPHTAKRLYDLLILVDQQTGDLHAAYRRSFISTDGANDGLREMTRVNGVWSRPSVIDRNATDYPDALTPGSNGRVIIGYIHHPNRG
jgi:hypothetical protein